MIIDFADPSCRDIYDGENTRAARRIPRAVWDTASRKLDMLNAARGLKDLLVPPGNRLEVLRGGLAGFHSIRINDQYRVIFRWVEGNAHDVRITDYH